MEIKIPIELFKGRDAFPLKNLGEIVQETEKFLKLLGEDIQLDVEGEWLATDVRGGSLTYTAIKAGIPEPKVNVYMHNYRQLIQDPLGKKNGHFISNRTRKQFATIAKSLNPGESLNFGIIEEKEQIKWHSLSKEISLEIIEAIEREVEYQGTIQGIIHDMQKETKPYYFTIRELSSQKLIKCIFHELLYEKIWEILKQRMGIVYVSGMITANHADEKIEHLKLEKAEDIMLAEEFREDDLKKFIGCYPDIIGKKSLREWINEIREHD